MTLKLKIFQCFLYAKIFLFGKYLLHGWCVTTHNYQVAGWSLLSLSPWWKNRLNPINLHQLLIASIAAAASVRTSYQTSDSDRTNMWRTKQKFLLRHILKIYLGYQGDIGETRDMRDMRDILPWDSCSSPPSCDGRSHPESRICWAGCRTRRCWCWFHWCTYSRDHGCNLNNRQPANCKPEYLRVSI